jgi:hypothetical protein
MACTGAEIVIVVAPTATAAVVVTLTISLLKAARPAKAVPIVVSVPVCNSGFWKVRDVPDTTDGTATAV